MSQATFDDEDLFGEAAAEMRDEVEDHLATARAELPTAAEIWETDADNTLGALNALKSALTVGEASDHVRQAKKAYVLGERADAFEDADDLAAEIEALSDLLEDIDEAAEDVTSLAGTIPQLRGALEEAEDGGGDEGADADGVDDSDGGDDAEGAGDADDADDADDAE